MRATVSKTYPSLQPSPMNGGERTERLQLSVMGRLECGWVMYTLYKRSTLCRCLGSATALKLPCDVTFGPKEPQITIELADHDPPLKTLLQQMVRLVPGFGQFEGEKIAIPISKLSRWHVAMVRTVI